MCAVSARDGRTIGYGNRLQRYVCQDGSRCDCLAGDIHMFCFGAIWDVSEWAILSKRKASEMSLILMIDDDSGSATCYTPEQQSALEAVGYHVCTVEEYEHRKQYQYHLDVVASVDKAFGAIKTCPYHRPRKDGRPCCLVGTVLAGRNK